MILVDRERMTVHLSDRRDLSAQPRATVHGSAENPRKDSEMMIVVATKGANDLRPRTAHGSAETTRTKVLVIRDGICETKIGAQATVTEIKTDATDQQEATDHGSATPMGQVRVIKAEIREERADLRAMAIEVTSGETGRLAQADHGKARSTTIETHDQAGGMSDEMMALIDHDLAAMMIGAASPRIAAQEILEVTTGSPMGQRGPGEIERGLIKADLRKSPIREESARIRPGPSILARSRLRQASPPRS